MPSPHLEAAISRIDEEIVELEKQIISLKRCRNALMPLLTLPPELVIRIITGLLKEALMEGRKRHRKHKCFSWLSATQFCAYWREIALGCSGLWGEIWFIHLPFLKLYVERTNGQLLDIDASGVTFELSHESEMFQVLIDNMHRVRSLRLPMGDTGYWTQLQGISAPKLEELELWSHSTIFGKIPPTSIGAGTLPNLRRLKLSSIPRDIWGFFLPSNLPSITDLILSSICLDDQLEMLSRFTAIRRLSVKYTYEPHTSRSLRVAMPQLEYLELCGYSWALFDHLEMPSIRQMVVYWDTKFSDSRSIATVTSKFVQCLNLIRTHTPGHLALKTSRKAVTLSVIDRTGNNVLVFHAVHSLGCSAEPTARFFGGLVQLAQTIDMSFQFIDIAIGKGGCSSGVHSLSHSFRSHPHISTIRISDVWFFPDLFLFSNPDSSTCGMGNTKNLCNCCHCHEAQVSAFPGLRTLILDDICKWGVLSLLSSAEGRLSWLRESARWLKERKERGLELDTMILRFTGGVIEETELDELRRVVTHLVVKVA
ncbi:hypothetical protein AX16_006758 [Volvariella volvacea WC 439]|nr:hypothetical protein AX16_006758 [Volvariella volvacea WC 439]